MKKTLLGVTSALALTLAAPAVHAESVAIGMPSWTGAQAIANLLKVVVEEKIGGKATLDQVQTVLVPDVIADDWKKWWETAKREMKKDGHYQLPIKKSNPIIYHEEEISQQTRLLKEFHAECEFRRLWYGFLKRNDHSFALRSAASSRIR